MKSVVLCGSRRYKKEVFEFAQKLEKRGIVVFKPIMNTNTKISNLEEDLKRFAFLGLTWHHLEFIRKVDVVFIYNKDGYIGVSSTLEMGAAAVLGKPIYALEKDSNELSRNVLIDKVVGSAEELIKYLK
ncbi:MAG TPA: hypothetical protein VMW25_06200 [Clostridia bacterium]|nr:hypothetical protein [Clostridia bacterium]